MTCRICGGLAEAALRTHEMMLGLGTDHLYAECRACGCLQITSIPEDLQRYYEQGAYYSLQGEGGSDGRNPVRAWVGNRLDRAHIFDERGLFGRLAHRRGNRNEVAERLKSYVGESPVRSWDAKILDVGCGSGALACELAIHGFRDVQGIDPYLPEEIPRSGTSPRLRRVGLSEISGESFDLILLTHVLEHVQDPPATIRMIAALLGPRGVCRVEVPVADSEAARVYGKDWVELDPPRHLNVPTRRGMAHLANKAGLEIYRSEPAGSGFEFWRSEMYRRGLTLFDRDRKRYRDPADVFGQAELGDFERRASSAAMRGESGRERFYLRRGTTY
jgi:SAM-dependent methyltransferase